MRGASSTGLAGLKAEFEEMANELEEEVGAYLDAELNAEYKDLEEVKEGVEHELEDLKAEIKDTVKNGTMPVFALVLNAGSSSLKYGLFELKSSSLEEVCAGLCDRIGLDGCVIKHDGEIDEDCTGMLDDHGDAMKNIVEILTREGGPVKDKADIKVVGHRVVHGGPNMTEPTVSPLR